ncbi:MAG: ROK family protein [Bacteroidota bacterium]
MTNDLILGIDIGASGIKGAPVNVKTGEMLGERFRLPTPKPSIPDAMAQTFAEVAQHFNWSETVGCGFPAIVKNGVAYSAANIHKDWIGTNASELFQKYCNCDVYTGNDADLAGMAEMAYGVGKGVTGTVLLITIGSGLGSALFYNGQLVPNTEFGHFYLRGQSKVAERYAADSVRKKKDLSWSEWGARFNEYLVMLERLFTPDLFILGGGSSKKFHQFSDQIKVNTPVTPARLLNNAGIIGAAVYAHKKKSMRITSKTF